MVKISKLKKYFHAIHISIASPTFFKLLKFVSLRFKIIIAVKIHYEEVQAEVVDIDILPGMQHGNNTFIYAMIMF